MGLMRIEGYKGRPSSPCMSQSVSHTFDNDTNNVVDAGFHIYTNSQQASLKVMLMDDSEVTLSNYDNEVLLMVKKVFATGTSTTSDIICYR